MSAWAHLLRTSIESLSELELQRSIVEPLLEADGFRDVRDVSGPNEKGRDLVAVKDEFGTSHYYAIQVKKLKVSGRVEDPQSLMGLLYQLDQAIHEEAFDPATLAKRIPDRLIFVTPYMINRSALDAALEKYRSLSRNQVTVVDGVTLASEVLRKIPHVAAIFSNALHYRSRLTSEHSLIAESRSFGIAAPLNLQEIFVEADYTCFDELREVLVAFLEIKLDIDGKPRYLRGKHNLDEIRFLSLREAQWSLSTPRFFDSADVFSLDEFIESLLVCIAALLAAVNEYNPHNNGDAIHDLHKRIIALQGAVSEIQETVVLRCASHLVSPKCRHSVAETIQLLNKGRRMLTFRHLYRSNSVVAITGVAGAGKSTLMRKVLTKAVEEDVDREVVFARAIDLNDIGLDGILKYLFVQRTAGCDSLSLEAFRRSLFEGKVRVMVDGIDEAGDRAQKLSKSLLEFVSKFERVPLMITTRETVDLSDWRSAIHVRLCPFTDPQIYEFTSRWFASKPSSRDGIQLWLRRNPGMMVTARTPLMAALMCSLYEVSESMMPVSEMDLYEKRLDFLLGRWELAKSIVPMSDKARLRYLLFLMHLAYDAHVLQERTFSYSMASTVSTRYMTPGFLPNSQFFIRDCVGRGLLVTEPNGDLSLGHLALQEFLVGKYLHKYNNLEVIKSYLGIGWWRKPLSFYASLIGDISGLLGVLSASLRNKHEQQIDEMLRLCSVSPASHPL